MSKIIVISGGSSGLGKEIARVLTPEYKVILLSRDEVKLKKTAAELNCDYKECDVGDCVKVQKAVDEIVSQYSRIDVVINSAGLYTKGKLEDTNDETIEKVYKANALGTIYLTKAVAPIMKSQKGGLIINIITQGGLPGFGKAERSIYYSSKMAVTSFTKSISLEFLPFGVRVTGVYPGKINTQFMEKQGAMSDMKDAIDPKEVANLIKYIVNLSPGIHIPEVGIKSSKQIS